MSTALPNARNVQLPPSPEHPSTLTSRAMSPLPSTPTANRTTSNTPIQTLRWHSIARYEHFTSLACSRGCLALAGAHGLSVTATRQLQRPVLLLSQPLDLHTQALQFAPQSQPLLLAGTRGSGVLLWDVSGHSMSPLLGRRGLSDAAVDLNWKDANSLVATTAQQAALWDIRQAYHLTTRFASSPAQSYVQIATNEQECALLNAKGFLSGYDWRMLGSTTPLFSSRVLQHAGVGLCSLPHHWVTWGLNEMGSPAVVQVWSCSMSYSADATSHSARPTTTAIEAQDALEDPNPSPTSGVSNESSTTAAGISLLDQYTLPDLACARVCAGSSETNRLVTLCMEGKTGWNAQLWNVTKGGLEGVTRFRGGNTSDGKALISEEEMGILCAADIAMDVDSEKNIQQWSLCTLTDKGFLATHIIPEAAINDLSTNTSNDAATPSPSRSKLDNTRVLNIDLTRLFPSEREVAIGDAARIWHKSGFDEREKRVAEAERLEMGPAQGPEPQFDMDLPATPFPNLLANPTAVNDLIQTAVPGTAEANEKQVAERRDAMELMKNIDTNQIPCPRLCGMTFGGIGGLAIFQNGDIRKVSSWWERHNTTKRSTVPGLIGEPSPAELNQRSEVTSKIGDFISKRSSGNRDYPRSLKDLNEMTAAARELQWGQTQTEDDEGTSGGLPLVGENLFEDDSDASSDSGDDQNDDFLVDTEEKDSKDLYSKYFGEYQRPSIQAPQDTQTGGGQEAPMQEGTPSDVLAPFVKITFEYDALAMNRQSVELAKEWKLGDITSCREGASLFNNVSNLAGGGHLQDRVFSSKSSYVSPMKTTARMVSKYPDEERGVHGGETAVRPNVQESMVFLKKLFTHQREGNESTGKLLSPPDGQLLTKGLSRRGFWPSDLQGGSDILTRDRTEAKQPTRGVFTLRKVPPPSNVNFELRKMKDLCIHNANVCKTLGEIEKHEVWGLIAHLVDMRLNESSPSRFDGWGHFGGMAFSASLIESILRYYKSLGDVQMLASIVCVLRGNQKQDTHNRLLIPKDREETYDLYLRKYADILYGWGELTIRAEVLKRLVDVPLNRDAGFNRHTTLSDEEDTCLSAIGLAFSCPRCSGETDPGTNFCPTCQDYAFRCAICENAVRGLFTVCRNCGHGGHTNHLTSWFLTMDVCPTGCGCRCTFVSSPQLDTNNNYSKASEHSTEEFT